MLESPLIGNGSTTVMYLYHCNLSKSYLNKVGVERWEQGLQEIIITYPSENCSLIIT